MNQVVVIDFRKSTNRLEYNQYLLLIKQKRQLYIHGNTLQKIQPMARNGNKYIFFQDELTCQ